MHGTPLLSESPNALGRRRSFGAADVGLLKVNISPAEDTVANVPSSQKMRAVVIARAA